MTEDFKITMRDLRAHGICKNVRNFLTRHNIDKREFLKNGVSAKTLMATGDAMAIDLVNKVRNGKQ